MSINLTDEIEVKTKKGKLGAAKQIFLDGDAQTVEKEIKDINSRHDTLNIKHESLSKTVQGISATGKANTATEVTYNNTNSGIVAENIQDAVDKLAAKDATKAEKSDVQSSVSELKAKNTLQDAEIAKKANSADVTSQMQTEQTRVNDELAKKFNSENIIQESGDAEDKVMSQKAVSTALTYPYVITDYICRIAYYESDFTITKDESTKTITVKCEKEIGVANVSTVFGVKLPYIQQSYKLNETFNYEENHILAIIDRTVVATSIDKIKENKTPAIILMQFNSKGNLLYNFIVKNSIVNIDDIYKRIASIAQKIKVLDINGNGDFKTIKEVLNGANVNDVVIVKPGTYIVNGGLRFKKGITFIGHSTNSVIFKTNTGLYSDAPVFYNGLYKNITFKSVKAKAEYSTTVKPSYAVHIDFMEKVDGIDFSCSFENCKFISECSSCVGVGMRKDFELRFTNCDFEYLGSTNEYMNNIIDARDDYKYSCLSVHNAANVSQEDLSTLYGSGEVILNGCTLSSNFNATLTLHNNFSKDVPTLFRITNSVFYSSITGKNCIYSSDKKSYITEFKENGSKLSPLSYNNNIDFLNA